MIAYNKDWLNNLLVRKEAEKASAEQNISEQEMAAIYNAYPSGFYTPNIFVRIGLFVLTVVIAVFTFGLFSLIILSNIEKQFGGLLIFFGLLLYAALEIMVSKRHFQSGVDDALLWMAPISLIAGLNLIGHLTGLMNAAIIFVASLILSLRFIDKIMAAFCSLAFLAMLFFVMADMGAIGKSIAPFLLMLAALLIYLLAKRFGRRENWKHYSDGFLFITIAALLALYVAGNYFVVREASVYMFNMQMKDGEQIPFGWLFWIFTIGIPIAYIIRGIQQKDRVLLRVGLLLVAAMVFTIRYYYHLIPAEIAMILGGMLFIILSYLLIKYLKEPKFGFSSIEDGAASSLDKLHLESLVIVQGFAAAPSGTTDTGTQFGGGSGGGGGASADF
jgi:hypothetical protein